MSKGFNINELKTDEDMSVEGVWCPFEGLELKIAHMNNRNAKKLRRKLHKKNRHAVSKMDMDRLEAIGREVIAKTVLLDWKNMLESNESGEEVEVKFSIDKAMEYLKIDAFMDIVTSFASDAELFQHELDEEDEGNFEAS